MAYPFLSKDEPLILTAQDIIVSGVKMEAILTNKRFVLLEGEENQILHEDIPLASIGSVMIGENTLREASLTLFTTLPTGERRPVELVFIQRPGVLKKQDRDRFVKKLKEYCPSLEKEAIHPNQPLLSQGSETDPAAQSPAQKLIPAILPKPPKPQRPVEALLDRLPLMAIPALLVIILAVVGGAYTYIQILHEKPIGHSGLSSIHTNTTQTKAITAPTKPLLIQQNFTPQVIQKTMSPPQLTIPTTGVWVAVKYEGNFTGSIGAGGILQAINATGDQVYRVPAHHDIVDVSIMKEDGSGTMLAVEIYNNGVMVTHRNMTTPWGLIDIHFDLKTI